ncbi:MAG: YdeI/OmpD-associated family protein [Phycisphaerae bacterium]|nr:MAG: hypothetical protein EDS66_01635 [Planctomycetota bacterium]KAB2944469.1 MAG: hypothetical protein F9K17_11300 [Phycisphaerae bacterium]MBE7457571.1 YdeI/OmpD-associated family protein [Planctomycetia bacterium]MCL4717373.1 YdeI/OmpD-associated family protein [Phycisphaerae bacterium]MCQ3920578.1 hypothetical protein [Planctomycetota bacterium]
MTTERPTFDPRIDAYIAKSADFAPPILTYLRQVVHEGCPNVTETLKWRTPAFEYKGLLCGMAAFKRHCTFGFWKHALVLGDEAAAGEAMGQFGRITKLSDLPSRRVLLSYVRKAAKLNDDGVKIPRPPRGARRKLRTPPDLAAALRKNKTAAARFADFSPSHRNEYIEWITEAKAPETRRRRLTTAIEWIAEGKGRNWKYQRK